MKNELVYSKKEGNFCDSRVVAKKFGKRHDNVMQIIDKLNQDLLDLAPKTLGTKKNKIVKIFKKRVHLYRGQNFRYVEMNKPAFSLLCMRFSGKKALEWQDKFNDAFYLLEQALLRQNNLEWKQEREQGKQIRIGLTDEIKTFIDYAVSQGSQNAKRYYTTITKMNYKALGLIEANEKIDKNFRNTLDIMDLHNLLSSEQVARKALMEGVEQKLHYKDIFQLAKQRVLQFADIILVKETKCLTN